MSLGDSAGGTGFRNRNRRATTATATATVNTGTPAKDAKVGQVDPLTGTDPKKKTGGKSKTSNFVDSKTALNPDMYGDTSLLKKPGYGVGPLGNVVHVLRREKSKTSATSTAVAKM